MSAKKAASLLEAARAVVQEDMMAFDVNKAREEMLAEIDSVLRGSSCWMGGRLDTIKRLVQLVQELESQRGDVMAGCDIERNGRLYRQVLVSQDGSGKTERDDVLEEAAHLVEREIERIRKLPEYDVPDEVPWRHLLRNRLEYVERCLPTAIRVMKSR